MHTKRKSIYGGYNFGVAFPKSFKKIALSKIPYYVCNRLRLSVFLVDNKGKVEKYNHIKLKAYKIGKEFRIDKKEFDSFLNKAKTNGK